MKYAIVTGASRGIGAGLTEAMLEDGWTVFGISRSKSDTAAALERSSGGTYRHRAFDFSHTGEADTFIEGLVAEIREETDDAAGGIYLVNNAGVLAPVGPVERTDAQESELHLKVNLLAPMRAAAGFIRGVDGFRGRKVVATISSGAAQRPYYGWSVYCSGKAGVEMWTRVAGFEQSRRGDPVHVFSIAPGIVETDMQASIRSMSEEEFIHRDSFVRYFERGLLADPWELGPLLLRSLDDPQIEQGATVDVRKLYG